MNKKFKVRIKKDFFSDYYFVQWAYYRFIPIYRNIKDFYEPYYWCKFDDEDEDSYNVKMYSYQQPKLTSKYFQIKEAEIYADTIKSYDDILKNRMAFKEALNRFKDYNKKWSEKNIPYKMKQVR